MKWNKRDGLSTIEDVFKRNIGVESLETVNGWYKKSNCLEYHIDKIDEAAKLMWNFVTKPVTIVGDYDADGITSTALISTVLGKIINDEELDPEEGILHHEEGVDLMPSNIELSGLEVSLVNVMSREMILKDFISRIRKKYDYILIDCMPSLGMVTVNAFAAADSILIPVQAAYLPTKGLEQLIKTIYKVKRQINPRLEIEGILITMVDERTNYAREIMHLLSEGYGEKIRFFKNSIPFSVRAAEISALGISIFEYDPRGKVAKAYKALTKEVLGNE